MIETVSAKPGLWRFGAVLLAAVVLALASVVLVGQRPAEAHDHRVPDTVLKKGARDLQAGLKVNESSWNQPAGNGECVNQSVIYSGGFPEVDRVSAGSKLRVRILKSQRPDTFEVVTYPKATRDAQPAGKGRVLPSTLRPVVEEERTVAWDALLSVNLPNRDYYLITEGHWQDTQGCPGDQFAFWSFHVKTRSA
ncbi:MAG: hypothetical protein ACRDTR_05845 [Rubrobacter sp.]